ncbi:hypothetical protein JOD45_001685 [Scopulibacillus daqui]|uniref:Uncharacterized protein n=1 Tax=Scopulibacillus daqui TaxID=1469162 RepID=A0ABS2PZK8_9BACL|nr:hypothetical protein [Scopulibacillus daqui]
MFIPDRLHLNTQKTNNFNEPFYDSCYILVYEDKSLIERAKKIYTKVFTSIQKCFQVNIIVYLMSGVMFTFLFTSFRICKYVYAFENKIKIQ